MADDEAEVAGGELTQVVGNREQQPDWDQAHVEEMFSRLLKLIHEDSVDVIQILLSQTSESNERLREFLMFASADNGRLDVDVLRYVFKQKSELDVVDTNGMTPLLRAAKSGYLEVVKLLLVENKPDLHWKDHSGRTALSWAASSGHIGVVEYLFRKGCDINALDMTEMSPVQLSIEAAHWATVKYLVGHGADINIADKYGTTGLQRAVRVGAWDMVGYLIGMGADVNVVDDKNKSPLQHAVDAARWDKAKFMVEKGASISNLMLTEKVKLLDSVIGQNDEEYREFYNVIRVNNVELLDMLIKTKGGIADDKEHPDVLKRIERRLAEAYEALKIRNVPLSPEIEFEVENKIITSRFFTDKTDFNLLSVRPSIEEVNTRIEMILDIVEQLNKDYSSVDEEAEFDLDVEFLIHIRFVAQNIRILKKLLKSTYNKLPWEEIEFCLVTLILAHLNAQDLNSIYRLVLNRESVLGHLNNFSIELRAQKSRITKSTINSKFPRKVVPTMSARLDVVNSVISNNPVFQSLYDDYKMISNVYSLQRIESYIKLALSMDLDKKEDLGKLVIERSLQVIGESLKNTIESPNVSDDIHVRLLKSAPENVRGIISSLRDSLSHSHALANKMKLEERQDITIFKQIQVDLEKINTEIIDILNRKKLEMLRFYCDKITNSKSLKEIKKLGRDLCGIVLGEDLSLESNDRREFEKLKMLIKDFSGAIVNPTNQERELFESIGVIVDLQDSKLTLGKSNFVNAAQAIRDLSNTIRLASDAQSNQEMSSIQIKSRHLFFIDTIEPKRLIDIQQIVCQILESVLGRIPKQDVYKLTEIVYQIVYQVNFEVGRVKGIDEFTVKLEKEENVPRDSVEIKIYNVFDEMEKSLDIEPQQIHFLKEIDSKRQNYEAKQRLRVLLNQLNEGTVTHTDSAVVQLYEELVSYLGVKKAKKRLLDTKFQNRDWGACSSLIENLRDNYEIFLNSVRKSIEKETSRDMAQHFKSLFSSIFKNPTILNKLVHNIDHILLDNHKEFHSFFDKRLEMLSRLISNKSKLEVIHMFQQDTGVKAAVEVLLLDLTEILSAVSRFGDNRLFLDQFSPLLIGKSLRNYLAHGDGLIDVLPFDPSTALVLTALNLTDAGTNLLTKENVLIGHKIIDNATELKHHYTQCITMCADQGIMFTAARNGKLEAVKDAITIGADASSRDVDGSTGLHYAAAGNNVDVMLFFLGNYLSTHIRSMKGQSILHIAAKYGSENIVQYLLEWKLIPVDVVDHDNITPLIFAASFGHADIVETLLKNGADIEAADGKAEMAALHVSAMFGHTDVVRVLLDYNANIDALCKGDATALYLAMYNNHQDIIDILLSKGARAVDRLDPTMPLLHSTLSAGYQDTAKTLLENGANVNEVSAKMSTPLHIAARFGQNSIVLDLLKRGANMEARNDDGWTPLDYAALFGQTEVAKILVDNGANVFSVAHDDRTPLHFASITGQQKVVEYLLDKGADVNCVNKDNLTPLMFAASNGETEVVLQLLERGANVNVVDNAPRSGALHYSASGGFKHIVLALLKNGGNVNARNTRNETPLHMSILGNHIDVMNVLLDYGAEIDASDDQNWTPLIYAAAVGSVDMVETLLRRGATIDSVFTNKATALHTAAELGHKDIVEALLRWGAPSDNLSDTGWCAIHYAAGRGRLDVVKTLSEAGSNVNILTVGNLTPLHLASISGHTDIIELLLANGGDINHSITSPTALGFASYNNHLGAVEVLLANGANVDGVESLSPLELAIQRGYKGIVSVLLKAGAKLDSRSEDGWTPLHWATLRNHEDIVDVLLDAGAEVNARNVDGLSALHGASQLARNDILVILLKRGADVNLVDNLNRTPLLLAAIDNHRDVVETLSEAGANVDSVNNDKMSALHFAARDDHSDLVDFLLKHNANVNAVDVHQFTPLLYAARNGHRNVVETVLENGGDVDSCDAEEMQALHYAARNGNTGIVDALLKHKANVNVVDGNKFTPLMYAARNGHTNVLRSLLEAGGDIEMRDTEEMLTALHLAAHYGHIDFVQALLDKRADANVRDKNNWTPLHYSACSGHTDIVVALLTPATNLDFAHTHHANVLGINTLVEEIGDSFVGALDQVDVTVENVQTDVVDDSLQNKTDVDPIDSMGWTPLLYATQEGHANVVRALLDAGADVNAASNDFGTPLQYAARQGHNDIVRELLDKGGDVNAPNKVGRMPLHFAAYNGCKDVVTALLDNGGSLDAIDTDGFLPLHYSAQAGHKDIATILLDHGSNVNAVNNNKQTPLHLAAKNGHTDVVVILLDKGGNVDAQDEYGRSALQHSAQAGHEGVVVMLLGKGSNMEARDVERKTALHGAASAGYKDAVEVLLKNGAHVDSRDINDHTPLYGASLNGQTDVVNVLSEHGAYIEARTETNWNPLCAATSKGHKDVVVALLDKGANVNARIVKNFTALHVAVNSQQSEISEILQVLLDRGANVDAIDDYELTALHYAVSNADIESVDALLAKGANVNVATKTDGLTALHVGAQIGRLDVVEALLRQGAFIEAGYESKLTPLHLALQHGNKVVAFTLLDGGVDFLAMNDHDTALHRAVSGNVVEVIKCILDMIKEKCKHNPVQLHQFLNAKDTEGDTPLMWATEAGRFEAAKLLLEYGVEIDYQNISGMTALHWAATNGNLQCVKLLIDKEANVNVRNLNGKTALEEVLENTIRIETDRENYEMIAALLLSVSDEASIALSETYSRH